jgi:hypothetical protein
MPIPQPTHDQNTSEGEEFLTNIRPLVNFIAGIFRDILPEAADEYEKVFTLWPEINKKDAPYPWSTYALNYDFSCEPHKDAKDSRQGYCWVIPFGDFIPQANGGGDLVFEDMPFRFNMAPGNLICFKSFHIRHLVDKTLSTIDTP